MAIKKYTLALLVAWFGLSLAPLQAQDVEEFGLDSMTETAEEDADTPKTKKKKKKSKKNKKSSKKKDKSADDAATDEQEADDSDDGDAKSDAGKDEPSKVAQALKNFKPVSGKPNMKAEYYIYMYSASWCGYCKQCMPDAVAAYKKIRRSKKVEFILIGGDKTREEAAAYLKTYKAKMPCIFFDDVKATAFQGLPGCGMPGFPAISIADKDGNVLKSVVGASAVKEVIANWKDYTVNRKD
ncbi:MAG: TlpA family protein disulfide reductase [Akkermansia sp.]|nr:TlpA family protein disulfide reductase [Akkermansia sp.]